MLIYKYLNKKKGKKMENIKFFDPVFSANERANNNAIMELAKWVTVAQLVELEN